MYPDKRYVPTKIDGLAKTPPVATLKSLESFKAKLKVSAFCDFITHSLSP